MNLRLRGIYKAIETTSVVFNDAIVPCRGLDNLDPKINRANLPIRLLLPVGYGTGSKNIILLDMAAVHRKATHTIQELALLGNFPEGKGLEEFAGPIVDYVEAYEDALKEHRVYPTFIITNVGIETGGFEWPKGSNTWYYGALSTLVIQEIA